MAYDSIDEDKRVWWVRRKCGWDYNDRTRVEDYIIQNPSGQERPLFLETDAPQIDEGRYLVEAAKGLPGYIASVRQNYYKVPARAIKLKCPYCQKGADDDGRLMDLKQDHLARHTWDFLVYINPNNDQAVYYCPACRLKKGSWVTHPLPQWARRKLEALGYLPIPERKYEDRKHRDVWAVLALIRQRPRITYTEIDKELGLPNGTAKRLCVLLKKQKLIKVKGAKKNQLVAVDPVITSIDLSELPPETKSEEIDPADLKEHSRRGAAWYEA